MYGNLDAALLWLTLIAKYLIKECNTTIRKAGSYIALSECAQEVKFVDMLLEEKYEVYKLAVIY